MAEVRCKQCNRPMTLTDEDMQRYYCYKDDLLYYAKENRWAGETPMHTSVSMCPSCQYTTPHVHYRRLHEMLVVDALLLVLVVFGLSFISGLVKGSTRLTFLNNNQIQYYTTLAQVTNNLLAPYQDLQNLVAFFDLVALAFVVASAVTLHHRFKGIEWHKLLAITAAGCVALDIFLSTRYLQLTSEALAKVPTLVDSNTLSTAMGVQQQFNAAYGFWASSTLDIILKALSWISVAALIVAAITPKIVIDYNPKSLMLEERVVPPTPQEEVTPVRPSPNKLISPRIPKTTKFCRYCGVKIPRTSKYCEECGHNVEPM